ncbi:MAG: RNA methyltransferase [Actinomycetota bacterium]|nr:RNA methyltransferase [Actinomycetota bacterium]
MTAHPLDVESTTNPRVKSWGALGERRTRDLTRTFLIEGRRETERALNHLIIEEVIWCPNYGNTPDVQGRPVTTVSQRVFDKVSRRQNPDGVAAVARTPDLSLMSFAPAPPALVLVADGIEKPGNIGAILRTCDALGAAFLGSDLGTDIVNPNVIRAAQGSLYSTPMAVASREDAVKWCTANTTVLVAHMSGDASLWECNFTQPTSIIIGAEHSGVNGGWLEAGTPTMIPMVGAADSLNASVSAAVFLAEAARQRSL